MADGKTLRVLLCDDEPGMRLILHKLVECVSKGGNLLLNVGPDARGCIPQESVQILLELARWMQKNGDSIYGCGYADRPKPENGRITRNGNKLYYHIYEAAIGDIPLEGLRREEVEKVRLLATGAEVKISDSWMAANYPDTVFVNLGPSPLLPDPVDTVLEVTLKA